MINEISHFKKKLFPYFLRQGGGGKCQRLIIKVSSSAVNFGFYEPRVTKMLRKKNETHKNDPQKWESPKIP